MHRQFWVQTTMALDYNTDNLVIITYTPYTGGNLLISNTLALSKHAMPRHSGAARYLIDHPEDYQYRLDFIVSTLPRKQEVGQWTVVEPKDCALWGDYWQYKNPCQNIDPIIEKIASAKKDFFIVTHANDLSTAQPLFDVFPNCKILVLYNSEKFYNLAVRLKHSGEDFGWNMRTHAGNLCRQSYDMLKGPTWPPWPLVEQCGYNIDIVKTKFKLSKKIQTEMKQFYDWHRLAHKTVYKFNIDDSVFDEQSFLHGMQDLYSQMGYTDFKPDLVTTYYRQYMELHKF